jgi:hypothetical protein
MDATPVPCGASAVTARARDCPAGPEDFEQFLGEHLSLVLVRPARKDEKKPRRFPNWLRQRVEAIIWTLSLCEPSPLPARSPSAVVEQVRLALIAALQDRNPR